MLFIRKVETELLHLKKCVWNSNDFFHLGLKHAWYLYRFCTPQKSETFSWIWHIIFRPIFNSTSTFISVHVYTVLTYTDSDDIMFSNIFCGDRQQEHVKVLNSVAGSGTGNRAEISCKINQSRWCTLLSNKILLWYWYKRLWYYMWWFEIPIYL